MNSFLATRRLASTRTLALRAILAGSAVVLLASHSAHAAARTWKTSPTSGNFSNSGNWDTAPASGDSVSFGTSSTTAITIDANTWGGGQGGAGNLVGITFTTGASAFTFNLGSFNLNLANNSGITMNSGVSSDETFGTSVGSGTIFVGTGTSGSTVTLANNSTGKLIINSNVAVGATPNDTLALTGTGSEIDINGAIGNASNLMSVTKTGSNIAILSGNNTYSGGTTVSGGSLIFTGSNSTNTSTFYVNNTGTAQFSGASGAMTSAASYTAGIGGSLVIDNTGAASNNNARIADTSTLSLFGGNFVYRGADAAATNSTETIGAISENAASGVITLTYGSTNTATLTAANLTHAAGAAMALVNGTSLGKDTASTSSVSRMILTTAPLAAALVGTTADVGTGINSGIKNTKIVNYLVGEATSTTGGLGTQTGTANTFLTYNSGSGLRPLNPTDEFTNNAITSGNNTYITTATNATTTAAINSLVINGGDLTITDGQTLTNTSGALLFASSNAIKPSNSTGALTFASGTEGQIYVNSGITGTITAAVTATGTNAITKSGAGNLILSGANTYSGNTQVDGGTLTLNGTNSSAGTTTVLQNSTLALGTGSNGGLASGAINAFSSSFNVNGLSTTNVIAPTISNTTGSSVTVANAIVNNQNINTTSLIIAGNSPIIFTGGLTEGNASGANGLTSNASAVVTFNTGAFNITRSGDANNRNFTISGTGNITINSVVAAPNGPNSGTLIYSGSGTLTLSNGSNSYTGGTQFGGTNATIKITNVNALNTGGIAFNLGAIGSTLILAAGATTSTANTLTWNQNAASTSAITLDAPSSQLGYTQTFGTTNFGQQATITFNQTSNLSSTGTVAFGAATFGANNSTKSSTLNPVGVNLSLASVTTNTVASGGPFTSTLVLDGSSTGNQITGAISGSGALTGSTGNVAAITKSNTSTWTLSGANSYTGLNTVSGGTLAGTQTSGTPFGTGAVTINGSILSLAPTGSGLDVALTGGTLAAATAFTFNPGAILSLNKGTQSSLTYTFGGAGTTWTRGTNGTLIISASDLTKLGLATAGNSERFIINGTAPVIVNALVSGVVGQDRNSSSAGDFLTYDATNGFKVASYTKTDSFSSSANTDVISIATGISTPTTTTLAYALKAAATVTNTGTIILGSSGNPTAGLILNGGKISGGVLTTPASSATEFAIYTSGTSEISSTVTTQTSQAGMSVFGPGTLALSSGSANTFIGGLRINSSTVIATNDNQLGGSTGQINLTGGTLQTSGTFALGGATGTRNIVLAPGQDQTGGTFNVTGGTTTFTSTTSKVISGSGSLTKTGAGTLVLATNFATTNTYTGGTNVNTGSLQLGASNMLADTGAVTVGGGTFDMQGNSETVGAVTLTSGSINGSGGTLTGSSYSVQSGSVSAILGGTGVALTKTTSGTVTLSGANSYTGPTFVSSGTLLVSGSISASTTTVSDTGTLGGSGGTTGAVNVNAGGTLSPGAGVGQLNTGTVTFAANSTLALEINTTTNTTDLLNTTGSLNLSLANDTILTIADLAAGSPTGNLVLMTYNGSWNGGLFKFGGSPLADESSILIGSNTFTFDYNFGGNSVVLVAVPEPGSFVSLLGGLGMLVGLRRLRRRRS